MTYLKSLLLINVLISFVDLLEISLKIGVQKEVENKKQDIIKEIGEGLTKILDATVKNSDYLDKSVDKYFTRLIKSLQEPAKPKPKDNVTITLEDTFNNKEKETRKSEELGDKDIANATHQEVKDQSGSNERIEESQTDKDKEPTHTALEEDALTDKNNDASTSSEEVIKEKQTDINNNKVSEEDSKETDATSNNTKL